MPVNLHVRNVDDDIALALKRRAASNGRSAEAEHRELLRAALSRPSREDVIRQIDAIRASTAGRYHTPSEILVRESRDER